MKARGQLAEAERHRMILRDEALAAWVLLEALCNGLRVSKAELRRRHRALKAALDETRRAT